MPAHADCICSGSLDDFRRTGNPDKRSRKNPASCHAGCESISLSGHSRL